MALRLAVGLGISAVMFGIAGRRFFWLFRLISAGEPAVPSRTVNLARRAKAELVEVGGQKKLLQWTVPGLAHAFTFWGFTLLLLTILEAYGDLFQRNFHIPLIGRTAVVGFVEDFFAVAVLVSSGCSWPSGSSTHRSGRTGARASSARTPRPPGWCS